MKMNNDAKFEEQLTCCFKLNREFDEFWPEHLKVSKIFTLIHSFGAKYMFWAKKYRGVIFHDTEEWYKIWRGIDLSFQSWHGKFDEFWPKHFKVSKIFPLMGSFWAKYILFELKNTEELSFMTLKSDTKLGEESTCCFKIDMRNLTNFDPEHLKVSKIFPFNGLFLSKVYIVWPKKVQRSYLSWHWRVIQNFKKNGLVVWKMTWGIWQVFTRALESVKIVTLMGFFCPK